MTHNEHLRKADESYEIRHDNNGNAIHVLIKDGEAIVFPTLHDFVSRVYFGQEVEQFYCPEELLSDLYESDSYYYYTLKEFCERVNNELSINN
jgi:hypothetical protein